MATTAQLRALIAAPELLAAARPGHLATAERLRVDWPADLVAAATEQAELRDRATAKFPLADRMLFTRAGLEQATSAGVAAHRARRFAGHAGPVLDLCCGIGGDLVALASACDAVLGVDRDEAHALLARHNSDVYGDPAPAVVADVTDVRIPTSSAVFIDPARRDSTDGHRWMSSPPLSWCLTTPAHRVCIKAAPGLDHALVPDGWEAEFVAVGRELKEATLWSPAWATASARATVLPGGASMTADPTAPAAPVQPPGRYLLDPSPAVTRAGAVADLAAALGAWQVDPQIAFLCGDAPLHSPFGRSFEVEASLPFGVKPLAAELRRLGIGSVDLRRRGLAGDVDQLRRRLRGRGERTATVMLTRVANRPWTFVCTELDPA